MAYANLGFEEAHLEPGYAGSWDVLVQASLFRIANYGVLQPNPIEGFEEGWQGQFKFAHESPDLVFRIFAGPKTVEDFSNGWGNDTFVLGLGPIAVGEFDTTDQTVEDFEQEWLANEAFINELQPANLQGAMFDGATVAVEAFVSGWGADRLAYSKRIGEATGAGFEFQDGGASDYIIHSGAGGATWATDGFREGSGVYISGTVNANDGHYEPVVAIDQADLRLVFANEGITAEITVASFRITQAAPGVFGDGGGGAGTNLFENFEQSWTNMATFP